jgi:hypothetical protein
MQDDYLNSASLQFKYYRSLGDKTFAQLTDEQLFWQYDDESNSIAIIVKHLAGNMLSRWTDFLHSDGEKDWRNRESEFENDLADRAALLAKWEEGWDCLFAALASIKSDDFEKPVFIRNQGHTVLEAVNRQLSHYAYHVGQITFIGKMVKGEQWKSLSIPKGKSSTYNAEKFSEPKHTEHFSQEFLDGEKGETH